MSVKNKKMIIIGIISVLLVVLGTSLSLYFILRTRPKDTALSPGEVGITYIRTEGVGNIAVRVAVPEEPRYTEGAPVVVVASTWFVEKYNNPLVSFHLEHDPTLVGAIFITNLWPGRTDPDTNASSDGTYDYGGPNCLKALRDTILFASGEKTNIEGKYLDELLAINPLIDNLGLYASSHAGVVATNVLAYFGDQLSMVKYFVGRENPTRDEMYPLEIGHFNDQRTPIFNPYYNVQVSSPSFSFLLVLFPYSFLLKDFRIAS